MININKIISLVVISVLISACAAYSEKDTNPSTLNLIICQEPRPQICTNEYNPVCARLKDGDTRTDATACTACSDPEVVGYKMGACKNGVIN